MKKRGKALPTIAESDKPKTIKTDFGRISPVDIMRRRRIKTHAPVYHTTFGGKEVIGQSEARKVIKAVKSGVPIVVPKINPEWAELPQHARDKNKDIMFRNEGITSARQAAPGRTRRRGGRRKRKRRKTRKRRKSRKRTRKHRRKGKTRRGRRHKRRTHKK